MTPNVTKKELRWAIRSELGTSGGGYHPLRSGDDRELYAALEGEAPPDEWRSEKLRYRTLEAADASEFRTRYAAGQPYVKAELEAFADRLGLDVEGDQEVEG